MKYVFGVKMSNKAKVTVHRDEYGVTASITGSPNDILKVVKRAEIRGFYPIFTDPLTLRNGRIYRIDLDEATRYWSVTRVV